MGTSVKRAISLPKEQDARLREIARQRKASYSALIQAAVRCFLDLAEREQWSQAYENYFAKKENVDRARAAARDFMKLSKLNS